MPHGIPSSVEEVAAILRLIRETRDRASAKLENGREKACVLTKLDEARMWLESVPT